MVMGLPVSSFCCIATWAMKRFGAAPCQLGQNAES